MPQCTNIPTRGCDSTNLTYDGHGLQLLRRGDQRQRQGRVLRARDRPPSGGPRASRRRGGRGACCPPAATTRRGPASASRRREAPSRWCGIYVDGTKVQQVAATGKTDQLFDVPNNLTSHSVMLEVCNEELACSQSAAQPVQTYGPLVTAHIHSITPTIDVTRISWTIEVDSNGDEATLTVTSDRGRNETFTVPVGVSTVTTQAVQLDYQQTENVTVTLSDGTPVRGPGLGHQLRHDRAATAADRGAVEGCGLQRRPGHGSASRATPGNLPGAELHGRRPVRVRPHRSSATGSADVGTVSTASSTTATCCLRARSTRNARHRPNFYFGKAGRHSDGVLLHQRVRASRSRHRSSGDPTRTRNPV